MFVFAINCFFGPDMGAFTEWCTRQLGGSRHLGRNVMWLVHDPFLYPLCVAPLIAPIWFYLITFKIVYDPTLANPSSRYRLKRGRPSLKLIQIWALCVAGGLSHFFFDTVFEENGKTKMYLWILSTGYWEDVHLEFWSIFIISILTVILMGGFLWINIEPMIDADWIGSQPASSRECSQVKNTWRLLVGVIAVYVFYLWLRIYAIKGPRIPVAGEEADLGVLVFFSYFLLLPLFLLTISCHKSSQTNQNLL